MRIKLFLLIGLINLNLFSQKIDWLKGGTIQSMPDVEFNLSNSTIILGRNIFDYSSGNLIYRLPDENQVDYLQNDSILRVLDFIEGTFIFKDINWFINNPIDKSSYIKFENFSNIKKFEQIYYFQFDLLDGSSPFKKLVFIHNNKFFRVVEWKNEPNKRYLVSWNIKNGNLIDNIYLGDKEIFHFYFDEIENDFYYLSNNGQNSSIKKINLISKIKNELISKRFIYRVYKKFQNYLLIKSISNNICKLEFINLNNNEIEFSHNLHSVHEDIGISENDIFFFDNLVELNKINISNLNSSVKLPINDANYVLVDGNNLITHNALNGQSLKYDLKNLNEKPFIYNTIHRNPIDIEYNIENGIFAVFCNNSSLISTLTLINFEGQLIDKIQFQGKFGEGGRYGEGTFKFIDDEYIVLHNRKNWIYIYNLENKELKNYFLNSKDTILDIEVIDNKLYLSTANKDFRIYNIDNFELISETKTNFHVKKMANNNSKIYCITIDNLVGLHEYDPNSNSFQFILQTPNLFNPPPAQSWISDEINFSTDFKYIYSCYFIYNIENNENYLTDNIYCPTDFDFDHINGFHARDGDRMHWSKEPGLNLKNINNLDFNLKISPYTFFKGFTYFSDFVKLKFISEHQKLILVTEHGDILMLDISYINHSTVENKFILESNLRIVNQNGEFYIESDEDYIGCVAIFDYVGKKYGDYNLNLKKGLNKMPDEFDYNFTKILVYKTANKTFLIK